MSLRLSVVVPTYRRPETLRSNLLAVLEQVEELSRDPELGVEADVLVVDNDARATACAVVDALGGDTGPRRVRYVVEPEPGITAARNRGLDECAASHLLVFVDDDETPEPDWLRSLVSTWVRCRRPAAVMGRVRSTFETTPEAWIVDGGFFVRVRRPTGASIRVAACGNLLLDLGWVRELGVRFDPRFGLTGGEDTMFSRQLVARGGRIVWCDESVAVDVVPESRANRRWVLERARRTGNTTALIDLALAESAFQRLGLRARAAARGGARVLAGRGRHALGTLSGSTRDQARGLRTASRGRGMLQASVGRVIEEYSRDG